MASGRGLPDARVRAAAVAGVDPHVAVDLYDCVFPDARDPRWTVGRDRDPPRVSRSQSELDEEVPSHRPAVETICGLPGRRAAWRSRTVVPAAGPDGQRDHRRLLPHLIAAGARSEERRVGKGGRSGWWADR